MSSTVLQAVEAHAGPETALIEPGVPLGVSYQDLLEAVEHIARQLTAVGVERGDAVALRFANGPELVAAFLGVARVGAAAAPLNPGLTPRETAAACADLRPRAILVEQDGLTGPVAERLAETRGPSLRGEQRASD